jgi:hypothetical protein
LATSATLILAIFSNDEVGPTGEEQGWFKTYQWPIYCGIGYLAAGYLAQTKLTKSVELHNGLLGDSSQPSFLDIQPIAASPAAIGPALTIRF